MWHLLPLLLVPLVVLGGFKVVHGERISWGKLVMLECGMSVLLTLGFLAARWGALQDTEIWSGRITDKPSGSQGCCHCRQECDTCTRTDSQGRTETYSCRCRTVCDHVLDYWWSLDVSTGDRISVKSCEPDPNDVPSPWINAVIGEPAAVPHTYTNYLLADPESVLLQRSSGPDSQVPAYPEVYALYKANRAIPGGTRMPEAAWNTGLMELNADLGSVKQVNIIVIGTRSPDPAYADIIEEGWLYGKKNDVIFVLGAPDGDKIAWASVVTISRVEMLKVTARDELVGMHLTDPQGVLAVIRDLVMAHFQRTPMAEFEYLGAAAKPNTFVLVLLYFFAVLGSIVGGTVTIDHRGLITAYAATRWR